MRILPLAAAWLCGSLAGVGWGAEAPETVLFIGNSFTMGAGNARIVGVGGVPGLVRDFAKERGLGFAIKMAAEVKLHLGDHLKEDSHARGMMDSQPWDAVVIQDLSTAPTHYGERTVEQFEADVKAFRDLIQKGSPDGRIVLFETWARHPDHSIYKTPAFPGGNEGMQEEVTGNTARVAEQVGAEVAPVGTAFLKAFTDCQDIHLYASDNYHANPDGCYLAALVLFATLYGADPRGLPAIEEVTDEHAKRLQEVAWEVVSAAAPKETAATGNPPRP